MTPWGGRVRSPPQASRGFKPFGQQIGQGGERAGENKDQNDKAHEPANPRKPVLYARCLDDGFGQACVFLCLQGRSPRGDGCYASTSMSFQKAT